MLSSLLALGIICAHAQASDSQSPKTKTPDNWPEASLDAISERHEGGHEDVSKPKGALAYARSSF
eukprot:6114557-Pleurochrysis_carterae.AAC.1